MAGGRWSVAADWWSVGADLLWVGGGGGAGVIFIYFFAVNKGL